MDIIKVITILNYLSTKTDDLTKLKAIKLLYLIDKSHLLKYGRFVTGDEYYKCPLGHVATFTLNFINDPDYFLEKEENEYLNTYITFSSDKKRKIASIKPPDLDELSESEKGIIDEVLKKYGRCSASELIDMLHEEYAYLNTKGSKISYKDIAHDADENRREKIIRSFEYDVENQKLYKAISNKANELIATAGNETPR